MTPAMFIGSHWSRLLAVSAELDVRDELVPNAGHEASCTVGASLLCVRRHARVSEQEA